MATLIISTQEKTINTPMEGVVYCPTKGDITKFFRDEFWSKFYGPRTMHQRQDCKCIIIHKITGEEDNFEECKQILNGFLEINDFKNKTDIIFWITCYEGFASEFDWNKYKETVEAIAFGSATIFFRRLLLSKQLLSGAYIKKKDFPKQVNEVIQFLTVYPYNVLDNISRNEQGVYYSIGIGRLMSPRKKVEDILQNHSYAKNLFNLLKPIEQNHFNRFLKNAITDDEDIKPIDEILEREFTEEKPNREAVELSLKHFWEEELQNIPHIGQHKEKLFTDYHNKKDSEFHDDFDALKNSLISIPDSINKQATKLASSKLELINEIYKDYKSEILLSESEIRSLKEDKEKKVIQSLNLFSEEILNTDYQIKTDAGNVRPNYGNVSRIGILHHLLTVLSIKKSSNTRNFTQGDEYTLNQIRNECKLGKPIERLYERIRLRKEFNSNRKNYEESIPALCSEMEEENGTLDQLKEIKEQIHFGVYDENLPILKGRYTKLTKWSVLTVLSIVLLNALVFGIGELLGSMHYIFFLFATFIPMFIGGGKILNLFILHKQKKKTVEDLILNISNTLNDYLQLHDNYVRKYLEQVRKDHLAKLVDKIDRNVKLKIFRLDAFREYILRHVLYAIEGYQNTLKQESDFVSYFPEIKELDESVLNEDKGDYFISNPKKLFDLYDTFQEAAMKDEQSTHKPSPSFNMLQEGVDPDELVEPTKDDSNTLDYKPVEEYSPVLFQGGEGESENEISYTDIKQGSVGNCYFLAALGAFTVHHKKFLKTMVFKYSDEVDVENDDITKSNDTYMIRLFDNDSQECYVAIDEKFWFLQDTNTLFYARYGDIVGNKAEIWPMTIEKAWAKANGGYENIVGGNVIGKNSRNYTDYCMSIAGSPMKYLFINNNKEEVINTLNDSLNIKKYPITCGSKMFDNMDEYGLNKDGIVGTHAYFITRYDKVKNEMDILNPHGKNHLMNKNIDFLIKNFDGISIFTPVACDRNFDINYQLLTIEHIKMIEDNMDDAIKSRVEGIVQNLPSIVPDNEQKLKDNIEELKSASKPMFLITGMENTPCETIMWGNKTYLDAEHDSKIQKKPNGQNEVGVVQIVRFEKQTD